MVTSQVIALRLQKRLDEGLRLQLLRQNDEFLLGYTFNFVSTKLN